MERKPFQAEAFSTCKGPEVLAYLLYSRNSKGTRVATQHRMSKEKGNRR